MKTNNMLDNHRDTRTVKTYRQMFDMMKHLTDEQLDSNITVQDGTEDECYPAELKFINESDVLDEDHPVIFFERTANA